MDEKELATTLAAIEIILKYGLPAAIAMFRTLEVDNPTLEQVQALHDRVPKPGTYF